MKAIVYRECGTPREVLTFEEIERPVSKDDEVLVRVHAASVNPVDLHILGSRLVRRMTQSPTPGTAGRDVSGVVESVGKSVTQFKPGDEIFGGCVGAFAEYACAKESKIVKKPADVTFEQAAAIPIAGMTALQALRDKGKVEAGQKVLVIGASGGVGTFAVQIAKHLGADVTGVCSTRNIEMVRGIGADRVIDYTADDFTNVEDRFDLIVDLAGNRKISDYRRVLREDGAYVGAGGLGVNTVSIPRALLGMIGQQIVQLFISQKFSSFMARITADDLTELGELVAARAIAPVIDRRYKLSECIEAMQYVSEKRACGKVVIDTLT
jgi:NADPH:quinone reductase-like Zn-dependent oxidoreductase